MIYIQKSREIKPCWDLIALFTKTRPVCKTSLFIMMRYENHRLGGNDSLGK